MSTYKDGMNPDNVREEGRSKDDDDGQRHHERCRLAGLKAARVLCEPAVRKTDGDGHKDDKSCRCE